MFIYSQENDSGLQLHFRSVFKLYPFLVPLYDYHQTYALSVQQGRPITVGDMVGGGVFAVLGVVASGMGMVECISFVYNGVFAIIAR